MPYPLPLTRTEAYLAYKAGVIQQSDLKPSLAVPRNGIDAWLAYWTGLAEDYPKREDGTPHILQEEEAYIAYLSGVINEYPEKCLRRVGAYLRYLISARWGRPDHPLNREELYLSLIKTQFIPSGDPSSDIVIDGTAKAPFVDVKMYGDTFQRTYTGKNLFVPPESTTSRGVTYTRNNDGSFNISGSATGGESLASIFTDINLQDGDSLTLSSNVAISTGVVYRVEAYNGNSWLVSLISQVTTMPKTITIPSNATRLRYSIGVLENRTVELNNVTFQLEKSASATSFEPYVGGQPSPSPDYPQNIQVVTGKQTVKVLGKNLLNITSPKREVTNAGLHITIADDGKITIDGTADHTIWPDFIWGIQWNTVSHNSCKYYFPKALEAATYSIKIVNGTVTGTPGLSVFFNDDGGENTTIRLSQPQAKTVTGVNGINRAYLTGVQSGTTFDNFQFYLQVESGTTATEVVPYSELDYEINLGSIELCKLGDYQDYIYKDGEDWKVHKELGKVTINGTYYNSRYGTNSYGLTQFLVELGVSDYYDVSGYVTMLSNSFTKQTTSFSNTQVQGFLPALDSNSHKLRAWIRISTTTADTTDQFKAWLNTNTPIFYYKLNTATDTTITDTTLIAQLEALVAGGAEDGTTYIKVNATDPNLPGLLYVEAPKYE